MHILVKKKRNNKRHTYFCELGLSDCSPQKVPYCSSNPCTFMKQECEQNCAEKNNSCLTWWENKSVSKTLFFSFPMQ